eukprot:2031341-Rhodomonas_salina.1
MRTSEIKDDCEKSSTIALGLGYWAVLVSVVSVASRGSRVKALDTRTYPRELYPLKTQSRPKYLYLRCLYCATHALCSVRTVLRLCYGMLVLCCDIAAVTGPVLFPYLAPVQTKGGGLFGKPKVSSESFDMLGKMFEKAGFEVPPEIKHGNLWYRL